MPITPITQHGENAAADILLARNQRRPHGILKRKTNNNNNAFFSF